MVVAGCGTLHATRRMSRHEGALPASAPIRSEGQDRSGSTSPSQPLDSGRAAIIIVMPHPPCGKPAYRHAPEEATLQDSVLDLP